jgi:myo-inositol-1(or 4)-monophosphatase
MNSLDRELAAAVRLAREAGAILRRAHRTRQAQHETVSGELATQAHADCDALIRAGLRAEFPDDGVYSERAPHSPERFLHSRVWMIDPLDGITSFASCGDEFSVAIGMAIDGEACLGVVYNPVREELVAGYRGAGVTINDCTSKISDVYSLDYCFITVCRREWAQGIRTVKMPCRVVPMAGTAYKLARVAGGLDDGTFMVRTQPEWSTCAGVALVKAASGLVTATSGEFIRYNRPDLRQCVGLVAAGAGIHSLLLRRVKETQFPTAEAKIEGAGA